MKRIRRYRWLLVVGMAFAFYKSGAQGIFAYRAMVDTIRKDAFYQVRLTPEIIAKCKADLADLRLLGPGDRFVSYVLKDCRAGTNEEKEWLPVPGAVMTQKDSSDKHSYIDLRFSEAYEIDRLAFVIRDPVFYKRDAVVFAEGAAAAEWMSVTSITLAPGATLLNIPSVKTGRLRIDITNADNAPLVINEVAGFQASRCLLAYLKAGSGYQVLAGNAQAVAPEYDLKYFTDSLTATPPILFPGLLQQATFVNNQAAAPVTGTKARSGKQADLLLWSILLAILILLVYFSVRMVKAITQKERHDRI